MSQKKYPTRAATRGGVFPPPKPLYSPLAFGSIALGAEDFPLVDLSARAVAHSVARDSRDTPVLETGGVPGASRTRDVPGAMGARDLHDAQSVGGYSSSLPLLTQSNLEAGRLNAESESEDDGRGSWTTMSRRTSRSHCELRTDNGSRRMSNNNSVGVPSKSEYETTTDIAANELTEEHLQALVRRYDLMANSFHVKLQRKVSVKPYQQVETASKSDAHGPQAYTPGSNSSTTKAVAGPIISSSLASKSRKATVEEVEDEGDLLSFSPVVQAGPSRDKGKGPEPGNWGNVDALQNFTEGDLCAQREALLNLEEINRIQREEEHRSPRRTAEFIPVETLSPKIKKRTLCKRSKSPKKRRIRTPRETEPVEVAIPVAAAANVQPRIVEPEKLKDLPFASDHSENIDRESKSGPSMEEVYQLLNSTIIKLEETQKQITQLNSRRERAPVVPNRDGLNASQVWDTHASAPLPRGNTPGRQTAENFFKKSLSGRAASVGTPGSPGSSDDSSSESDSERSDDNAPGHKHARSKSPRLSSKRKRRHEHKQKMCLKPISPS
ncbi:hypothetical protein C8R44DRAFT_884681 [Mycena epipterygia]|nr:hypothetical protein C8R44DRAFT_884681 [Mycena epipterygia]